MLLLDPGDFAEMTGFAILKSRRGDNASAIMLLHVRSLTFAGGIVARNAVDRIRDVLTNFESVHGIRGYFHMAAVADLSC